jgi:hypothetical protein
MIRLRVAPVCSAGARANGLGDVRLAAQVMTSDVGRRLSVAGSARSLRGVERVEINALSSRSPFSAEAASQVSHPSGDRQSRK